MKFKKKGNLNNAIGITFTLLILAALIIGVEQFGSTQTAGSAARNLTSNIGAMSNNLGSQLPTVGTMIGIGLMIGAIAFLGVWGYGKVRGM